MPQQIEQLEQMEKNSTPRSCKVGEQYLDIHSKPVQLYVCTTSNEWVPVPVPDSDSELAGIKNYEFLAVAITFVALVMFITVAILLLKKAGEGEGKE
jgi:hypothetical protein